MTKVKESTNILILFIVTIFFSASVCKGTKRSMCKEIKRVYLLACG